MKWRRLAVVGLTLLSCSDAPDREVSKLAKSGGTDGKSENLIAKASASRSLIFPLVHDANLLPGFTKVDGREAGELDAKELTFAVLSCGTDLSWYEGGSHWAAIVIPSSSSTIWENVKAWHPSDAEIIDCVRRLYPRTFSYTVRDVGYDTIETVIYDSPGPAAQR